MDLSKLTPAPWGAYSRLVTLMGKSLFATSHDAEFIALARNAFAIQMAHGWYATRNGDEWLCVIPDVDRVDQGGGFVASNPLDAIMEAHAWYLEHGKACQESEAP